MTTESTRDRLDDTELNYLRGQRLGRLATVDGRGRPQANPVGFFLGEDGTIDIGGYSMDTTKKWRNIGGNPNVSLVVDDIASMDPWQVRGVEIRGVAEQVPGPHRFDAFVSQGVIRIRPYSVYSWGLDG
jgi:pyridoxamine 5'-phosphate oxidase family protein